MRDFLLEHLYVYMKNMFIDTFIWEKKKNL